MIITEVIKLLEKTFQIQEDVNLMFELIKTSEFYKKVMNLEYINNYDREKFLIYSKDLKFKTSECLDANSKNPFNLYVNVHGSSYTPGETFHSSIIRIGLLPGLYDYLISDVVYKPQFLSWQYHNQVYTSVKELVNNVVPKKYAIYEFADYKIKGSIHHELIHWLDDTLHNKFILKFKNAQDNLEFKDAENAYKKSVLQNKSDSFFTTYELNSIIGNIKEIKNSMSNKDWNMLTLGKLFDLSPVLSYFYTLNDESEKAQWIKQLLKRLSRENLLGTHMNKFK